MAQSKGFGGNKTNRLQAKARKTLNHDRRTEAFTSLLAVPSDAPWADRFAESYEFHRQARAAQRNKRRAQANVRSAAKAPTLAPEEVEDQQRFVAAARDQREIVDLRFKQGFRWAGGYIAGTKFAPGAKKAYYRSAFVYRGLRSLEHPILRKLVACTSRSAKLRSGHSKGCVSTGGSKVLGLDAEYVQGTPEMRSILRVELDRVFPSWEALREAIAGRGVRQPNILVGHVDPHTGAIHNPHLIWILEKAVCFTPSGKWRNQVAFRATLRQLTHALMPIGADPGGLNNSLRFKNPLSPLWSYQVGTEAPFESLDVLREGLRYGVTDEMLFPAKERPVEGVDVAAAVDEALEQRGSNSFFGAVRSFAFSRIAFHHPKSKDRGSQGEFIHEVLVFAYELADQFGYDERHARKTAESVAEWTWAKHDPERYVSAEHLRAPNRGVLRDEVAVLETERDRKAAGGRYTAAKTADASLEALVAAYGQLVKQGAKPTQEAVQQASGKGIATVKRHWKAVLAAAAEKGIRRCIDKKVVAVVGAGVGPAGVSKAASVAPVPPGAHIPVAPSVALASPGVIVPPRVERPTPAVGPVLGEELVLDASGAPVPPAFLRRPRAVVLAQPDSPASRRPGWVVGVGGTLRPFSSSPRFAISRSCFA